MKKILLLLLVITSCAFGTLTTKTPVNAPKKESLYNWNYWSYELGIGVAYFNYNRPSWPESHPAADKNTQETIRPLHLPLVDFRLGLEKSWHFAKNVTATVDLACLTPAATIGYLVSPQTRIYIGTQYSLLLNHAETETKELRNTSSILLSNGERRITHDTAHRYAIRSSSPLGILTPRIGVDHFVSPSTLLRFNLSYDWRTFYDSTTQQPVNGSLHWPQLTIGIKKFF